MYPVENNPSLSAHNLLPALENNRFLDFAKAYYDWMQSSKIIFVNESGSFTVGETVVGQNSKASGIVKQVGEGFVVLKMISERGFDLRETFTGQTSTRFATVFEIEDNTLRKNARIVDDRLPSDATGKSFEYLKGEFNKGIPTQSTADRRLLAKKIKDLYSAKSNEDTYRFLFNTIYGEEIDFRFPGEEVLRVSDGKFEKTIILRADPTDDIFSYLNQTVRGESSAAVGNVVDIKRVFFGGIETAEMTLKLVSGTFAANENIFIVGRESSNTTVYGMLTGVNIVDAGSGYSIGDTLTVTGDGFEAAARVSSISKGPINRILVSATGFGYQVGTLASVSNSGTGGLNFSVVVSEIVNPYTVTSGNTTYTVGEVSKVSIVNRGQDYERSPVITLIDTQIQALGLLTEKLITIDSGGSDYTVGDVLVFTGGAGAGAAGVVASVDDSAIGYDVLFEDGGDVILETASGLDKLKDESWVDVAGAISRIELTNFGSGYTSLDLPTVDVTSVSGVGAILTVEDIQGVSAGVEVDVANNTIGIGSIREVEITNFGIDYSNATIDATGSGDGNAILEAVVSGLAISSGRFLNDDGKVGVRIVQDSLFYQDFSYVIRSGLPFSEYRSLVKDTLHPAGTEFFGEILISSYLLLAPIFYSTIDTEKNNEYVATLKSVISFFDAGVITPPTSPEVELEIVPDVIEVASHPTHHREMNVEIALPKAVAISVPTVENNLDFELYIDVGLDDPYTEIRRELEIVPDNIVSNLIPHREINVEIALPKTLAIPIPTSEREIDISLFFDVGVEDPFAQISQIQRELVLEITLDKVLTISTPAGVEYKIEIASNASAFVNNYAEYLLKVETGIDILPVPSPTSLRKSVINQTNVGVTVSNPFAENDLVFADLSILSLADSPISQYADNTFEDVLTTRVITRQVKVDGTVNMSSTSVLGTGTNFTSDFSTGQYFIIGDEKFIVTSVANSTYMEVNVNPTGSYTDSQAYREISL
jgi:hypothetical protein